MIKICSNRNAEGRQWDDNGRTEIARILISHTDEIKSIQFQYVENGTLVLSDLYGFRSGSKFDIVSLNYPSEYITSISGCQNSRGVTSLAFGTNQATYGPYGDVGSDSQTNQATYDPYEHVESQENDKEFRYNFGPDQNFGGFFGKCGLSLMSIGVHINLVKTLNQVSEESGISVRDRSM